ncbi:hypothetical protein [Desulfosediminicola flagellatus]|uniref:hypothetical protein n=1 Tax=Desulfosediminicola flagellatus TaxID=2569541 RepID=UPI0010ABA213|nr:hypothetical protein [Desulfosediminicola flagellatus]
MFDWTRLQKSVRAAVGITDDISLTLIGLENRPVGIGGLSGGSANGVIHRYARFSACVRISFNAPHVDQASECISAITESLSPLSPEWLNSNVIKVELIETQISDGQESAIDIRLLLELHPEEAEHDASPISEIIISTFRVDG